MNEQVARDVVLVRAIETMDIKSEILSQEDRMYASRSAKELAQWQAADSKSPATGEHFLQQRAELILKRLSERTPAFAAFAQRRPGLKGFSIALPVAGLILGAGLDRITDPHRVDLLSAPLLAIIGWNLLVYVILLAWLFVPSKHTGWAEQEAAAPRQRGQVGHQAQAAAGAVGGAAVVHVRVGRAARPPDPRAPGPHLPPDRRHVRRRRHAVAVCARLPVAVRRRLGEHLPRCVAGACHPVGAVRAGVGCVSTSPVFRSRTSKRCASRSRRCRSAGARWVHLYAGTLLLLVVLPRLVLACVAHWRARTLARHFPLDLDQPYFRKLTAQAGANEPGVLRVLPYSFSIDEARDRGLSAVAAMLLGEQARVMLRPSSAYGEELKELAARHRPERRRQPR